ncbi:OmpW family outer membrane protein [Microbulbifer sp. SAOS-129_SWC]|uniref:OmpW/AlkL family protein n=1 Tax=Microbulbifer sp. SAOS-129_SWC TaxID=3145235 RepID=UPI003217A988
MKMTRILTPLALAVSAAAASTAMAGPSGYVPAPPPAGLYKAGTAVVRIGASEVDPDDSSSNLRYPDLFPFYDGSRVELDSDTTWNFSAMFMPADHFGVEFTYTGQSDLDMDLRNLDSFYVDQFDTNRLRLGTLKSSSGTLMFNWFPVCTESWVQPYVGIGANYTDFDSLTLRGNANDYLSIVDDGLGVDYPGRVYVDNRWGWAGQVGVDILFGRDSNWLVNAAVQYLDVETTMDIHYPVENNYVNSIRTDLDVDPWIYNLGIGYKF